MLYEVITRRAIWFRQTLEGTPPAEDWNAAELLLENAHRAADDAEVAGRVLYASYNFV